MAGDLPGNDIPVITRLRARSTEEPTPPTLAQLKLLRDSLTRGRSLDHTARLTGLSPDECVRLVVEIGTWIRQSSRIDIPDLAEKVSDRLFELTDEGMLIQGASGPAAPEGFIEAGGRTVTRPLATLLTVKPTDQQLERWQARTYTAALPLLTFPVVACVWRFATLDMLDKLEDVSPSPRFAKVAVEAWDTLEQTRQDGIAAVSDLVGPVLKAASCQLDDGQQATLAEKVAVATGRASWLSEKDFVRIARAAEQLRVDRRAQRNLAAELTVLGRKVASQKETYHPTGVGEISEGQMLRICRAAGLPTEPTAPARVAEIRRKIQKLGLGRDADQLTPNAVVADQVGVLEEYMDAVEARAAGADDWLQKMLTVGRR